MAACCAEDGDEPKEKVDFECRLCGQNEYQPYEKWNRVVGPAGRTDVLYYFCGGCSAMFKDPKKFTAATRSSDTSE